MNRYTAQSRQYASTKTNIQSSEQSDLRLTKQLAQDIDEALAEIRLDVLIYGQPARAGEAA